MKQNKQMAVLFNGVLQLEYHHDRQLTAQQSADLRSMDVKMNEGIEIAGEWIATPDLQQKSQFVAAQLYQAFKRDHEPSVAALSSYLADRLPDLKQVKLDEQGDELVIEFVFSNAVHNQVKVPFIKH